MKQKHELSDVADRVRGHPSPYPYPDLQTNTHGARGARQPCPSPLSRLNGWIEFAQLRACISCPEAPLNARSTSVSPLHTRLALRPLRAAASRCPQGGA